MRNDIYRTGAESIVNERDRQVMENGHTIQSDAIRYRNGELVQVALAIIHNNIEFAPADWDRVLVQKWLDLPAAERLIVAGAFLSAQIDVFNFYTAIDELTKKHAANVPEKKIYIPESEN